MSYGFTSRSGIKQIAPMNAPRRDWKVTPEGFDLGDVVWIGVDLGVEEEPYREDVQADQQKEDAQ